MKLGDAVDYLMESTEGRADQYILLIELENYLKLIEELVLEINNNSIIYKYDELLRKVAKERGELYRREI